MKHKCKLHKLWERLSEKAGYYYCGICGKALSGIIEDWLRWWQIRRSRNAKTSEWTGSNERIGHKTS